MNICLINFFKMIENSRNVFTITVEEFKDVSKSVLMDFIDLLKQQVQKEDKESNDVMSIDDVSKITGYKLSTIYTKISRKEMPVLSNRRPLLFSKNAILKWINSGRPSESERIANEFIINKR